MHDLGTNGTDSRSINMLKMALAHYSFNPGFLSKGESVLKRYKGGVDCRYARARWSSAVSSGTTSNRSPTMP
ncbi:hypothetical protein J2T14_004624 [Paenibacillus harenae]|nr:hypothetical protein [Paenibacillus harenae]